MFVFDILQILESTGHSLAALVAMSDNTVVRFPLLYFMICLCVCRTYTSLPFARPQITVNVGGEEKNAATPHMLDSRNVGNSM
jgi:hypothetical protein